MNKNIFRIISFTLALILICYPLHVHAKSETVLGVIQPHTDSVNEFVDTEENEKDNKNDTPLTDSKEKVDIASIQKEIDNHNRNSVSKLANKMAPAKYDMDKVISSISEEITKTHPESLTKLDKLASVIKKETIINHLNH